MSSFSDDSKIADKEADAKLAGDETDSTFKAQSSKKIQQKGGDFPNSWTRRLFDSEYLYEPRLAVLYLYRYPNAFGLQYYLCSKLESLSVTELLFYIPQLSHLLLNRKSECWALEKLLLDKCRENVHIAVVLIWLIRAHLCDLTNSVNPEAASCCKQIYNRFKSALFNDFNDSRESTKLQTTAIPALIGIGSVLAALLCTPLAKLTSKMVLGQASTAPITSEMGLDKKGQDEIYRDKLKTHADSAMRVSHTITKSASTSVINLTQPREKALHSAVSSDGANLVKRYSQDNFCHYSSDIMDPFTPEELSDGMAFSFLKFLENQNITTKFDIKSAKKKGNNLVIYNDIMESLQGAKTFPGTSRSVVHMKKSSFYYNVFRFMSTLADISDRLIAVPRESRQNTLLGELSLLNYNLPAVLCIPFYCNKKTTNDICDYAVMQIVLSESVVLNSSERAPYLMTLEVVDNTLENIQKLRSPRNELLGLGVIPTSRKRLSTSINGIIPRNVDDCPDDRDAGSNAYHERIMNRRKSRLENLKSFIPHQSSNESDNGPHDDSASDAGSHASFLQLADSYSERMHTTALMLSQLYQNRLSEKLQSIDQSSQNSDKASRSFVPFEYAKSIVYKVSQKAYPTSRTPDAQPRSKPLQKIQKDKAFPKSVKATFDTVRDRLLNEMATLEQQRMEALEKANISSREDHPSSIAAENISDLNDPSAPANADDSIPKRDGVVGSDHSEAVSVLNEAWKDKEERLKMSSPYSYLSGWRLISFVVKSGADMRQEFLAMQIIEELKKIFKEERVPVWIKSFGILVISNKAGLVETVRNSMSVDSIKRHGYRNKLYSEGLSYTLYDYFTKRFGHYGSPSFLRAQDAFMRSLAAYSLMCYLFQVKDRHNGNILVDDEGHLIHIDFGFILSNSPGSLGFEMAPFKLSQEYIDILGGSQSEVFDEFRSLVKDAFAAVQKHSERIITLVEIMERGSHMACFTNSQGKAQHCSEFDVKEIGSSAQGVLTPVTNSLRSRFNLYAGAKDRSAFMDKLINSSYNSYYTRIYDMFQYYNNGYF